MRKLIVFFTLLLPCHAAESRYLQTVRTFVDTMMARGVDHYGPVHSPLFAAMLDLKTLELPVQSLPEEFFRGDGRQRLTFQFGFPNPPVGIRAGDRAPMGNNLEHDINLLRSMYELTLVTVDKKYAAHADAYIRFWLLNCQSPETGFMASGEHNSWDFVRERAWANTHEVYRRFPFWDKLYAIDPYRAARIADAMWMAQIGNNRVKGRWCYLYRAIDSAGATIDFLLSGLRDADAAKRLFRKALSNLSHPQPRVINTDLAPIYGSAIPDIKKEGTLRRRCRHRPVQYLNNILEQDHRAIKRRVNAKQGFREFQAAQRTIQGYEAMNMMRKGQVRWVSGTDVRRQVQFINKLFELAA